MIINMFKNNNDLNENTPWQNPTDCHKATSLAVLLTTSL